ncbi:PAS domain-containing sensor histidine kinase [Aquibaculum arenosum]|uniref:histidine kinase n=1 Tax=Aquibaculum arenosum TaxID=3032591 RepID=A0ABT5YQZ9_9PROT|nr:PAS domain-containing sensor histidine kinase [Fodinicurvata sp. CAU 1616]MDF2097401.1 PAS domain S-box protein [Fodinicurvata sp. CAU 1616]
MGLSHERTHGWQSKPAVVAGLAGLALLVTFVFDLLSEMGVAVGVLYVLPVMLASLLPWRQAIIASATTASALTLVGYIVMATAPESTPATFLGLSNRLLTLVAIWATATLGLLWTRKDERLREERARLEAVIGTSADAVITIDQKGIVQSFSRVGEKLFGYRADEVIGRNVSMLMPSPDREKHDGYLERYLRTGEKRIIGLGRLVQAQRKDGSVFPVHLMVGEVTQAGQRLFTGFIHDMSERVAAEQAVASERNFIAAMLDTTQALVVVLDQQGRVVRSNAACQRLSGYGAGELVGRSILELIPDANTSLHGLLQRGPFDAQVPNRWEGSLLCKGGEVRLVSWSTAAIQDDKGVPHYLVTTGIDMTENRRSEARAQELQHHLYRIGRISELGEMASAIAHELNQPMTAVANYVNASRRMLDGVEDEKAERIIGLMNRAVEQTERAGQIVRRLRQLIGRGQSELQPTDLNAVVREASGLALIGAREEAIEVRFDLQENLPLVLADATQLQQVVLNLVRNAIEALQAVDHRSLLVSTSTTADNVELSVSDSGPGLDPEVADQLFMPFVSTKANGMGIGLSICRSILDAHQGQIRAEPVEGGGTRFRVSLPVMDKRAATYD